MSIIQDIRDKYAKVAVIAVALALIGFILTDYISGRGRRGGGGPNSVGTVNGISVRSAAFSKKVEHAESNMRAQGYPANVISHQAVENAWNEEINRLILKGETDKLGLAIGKKEFGDILYGPNAPEDLKKQLSDSSGFDPIRAKQAIDRMLKDPQVPQEQKDNFNVYAEGLSQQRLSEKYTALLANTVNYPRWFIEKQNADASLLGKATIVRELYSSIADSTVKIEDKEIADYINKHKQDYKQEESRSISYVNFNAAPSAADSMAIRNQLVSLKPEFDSTKDVSGFMSRNNITGYTDKFVSASQIGPLKDSVLKLPKGGVLGPVIDGPEYVMYKLIDTKLLPDTVKVRHILIATTQRDPQTGQTTQVRDTVTAYKLADSARNLIAKGENFDSVAKKLSEDPGSKDKGGVYDAVYYGQMVPEFNDFIFEKPMGSKGIVKTDFGYHYIEIMQQKGNGLVVKFARLPAEIIASQETDNKALDEANQFAADSRDLKGYDENFEKTQKPKGRVKGVSPNITPMAAQVPGVGYSRSFVRNIYAADFGEVLKPERVDDNYVVAVVTAIYSEGTKTPEAARQEVEPVLRNKKKAAQIKAKIGAVTTLEAAASKLGKQLEPIDSVRINSTAMLGYEPKVSGAIFNPANKGKVVPEALEGVSGVYVVRVEGVSATSTMTGDVQQQRNNKYIQFKNFAQGQQSPNNPLFIVKKAASIKDKRSTRY